MESGQKYLKKLGAKVRKLRDEREMSQQDLADLCDVAKSTIQRIENGSLNPTILMLMKISDALKVDIVEIIKT